LSDWVRDIYSLLKSERAHDIAVCQYGLLSRYDHEVGFVKRKGERTAAEEELG
jgi:hypothetical protein